MLLLPLRDKKGAVSKLLGCTFATEPTAHLGNRALVYQRLEQTKLLIIGDAVKEELPAAVNGDIPLQDCLTPPIREKGHLRLVVSQDLPGAKEAMETPTLPPSAGEPSPAAAP